MSAALLLTLLALVGVAGGVMLGEARSLSNYLTAAGGGLLFGISVFWLLPESAAASGWFAALGMTGAACLVLSLLDRVFVHSHGEHRNISLGPLLLATAVHSLVDGWSVRALLSWHMAGVTAPLGLALHKIPEGVALGWIARQKTSSRAKAAGLAAAAELFTLIGALWEPIANRSGFAAFGPWWTSAVVSVISGSFLYFALHAVAPNRRRIGALLVFLATLALVGSVTLYRAGNVF